MVQRNTEPQQSYDSILLDLEDKIEGGDDEIHDWEQDLRDVRGVRDVRVFNEEGLNPSCPDICEDNEVPYAVNESRVMNKKLSTKIVTPPEN